MMLMPHQCFSQIQKMVQAKDKSFVGLRPPLSAHVRFGECGTPAWLKAGHRSRHACIRTGKTSPVGIQTGILLRTSEIKSAEAHGHTICNTFRDVSMKVAIHSHFLPEGYLPGKSRIHDHTRGTDAELLHTKQQRGPTHAEQSSGTVRAANFPNCFL
jgi:hypothetical protein